MAERNLSFGQAVTVEQAIAAGARALTYSETPRLDARIIMRFVLDTDDAGLISAAQTAIPNESLERYRSLIERRAQGEPVAYLTGVKEFWSLPFQVTPEVLIPRDDTGALVEAVLARRRRSEPLSILDLGTGSGALLCALLKEFPAAAGLGADCAPAALRIAAANAEALGLSRRADFVESDWLLPIEGVFDVIVANPPYIREGERSALSREVGFEPANALFAGADGLDAYRRILPRLARHLAEDGLTVMECGCDQVDSLGDLLETSLAGAVFTITDLAGRPRGAGVERRRAQKHPRGD